MSAPAVCRGPSLRSRGAGLTFGLSLAGLTFFVACSGGSGPTGPEPGPPPVSAGPPAASKPLFAFKAGLDQAEMIWLWLQGDGLHAVSTWPADDPVTTVGRSTAGYAETFGRFGPLRFDHERRFLVTSERIRDATRRPRPPSRRLITYEIATGNVIITKPITDWTPEVLVTPTATLVVAPVPGRAPGKPWLYSLVNGKMVPAPGAAEIVAPDSQTANATDVGGEPVLAVGRLVIRRQGGVWRTIEGLNTTPYWQLVGSPSNDAACIIGREPGSPPPTVVYLLTAAEGLRQLPCQGRARSCNFSPSGEEVYLDGCQAPVIGRDLVAHPAANIQLQPGANVRMPSGDDWRTLGSVSVPGREEGALRPVISVFDWKTRQVVPLPAEQFLPDRCGIISIEAPPSGQGIAVVRTHCGCVDCYDGSSYALDLTAQKLHLIHDRGEALIYGAALLGSAAVTTMTGTSALRMGADGVPMIYWSDAAGTRMIGPLPQVMGLLHNPIPF